STVVFFFSLSRRLIGRARQGLVSFWEGPWCLGHQMVRCHPPNSLFGTTSRTTASPSSVAARPSPDRLASPNPPIVFLSYLNLLDKYYAIIHYFLNTSNVPFGSLELNSILII
ncbi:hypothetical protein ACJX0J_037928, partial [Zea mays]